MGTESTGPWTSQRTLRLSPGLGLMLGVSRLGERTL